MAEARPSSRNADMQTEHNEEFPPLFEARTKKQARTYGKKRFTLLVKRIENHMNEGNSRTELKFLRKELANQLEECTRAHSIYCSSKDLTETPSEDWIIQLENITATMYGRIDEYIKTINRPPSAKSSNPGSDTRTIHSQHSKLNLLDVQSQINEESASASISQISTSVSSAAQTVELRQRLDSEKLAREELEKKFQQLQTDIAAKHQRKNEENILAIMLSEEIKTLRSSINQYQLGNDQEMKQRRDLEKSLRADLDKQRNELEMEKLARRTDKHQYKREKESELEKMRLNFDERLARHAFLHKGQSIKHPERTQDHLGARPKQHQQFTASDSEPKVLHPPSDKKASTPGDECLRDTEVEKTIDSTKWSFSHNEDNQMQVSGRGGKLHSVFRLPKMDLKPFDGDPKNWQDFIAIFRDLVHHNADLTTTQKMAVLKRCLTTEVRDGLGDSLSNPALYQQALQELESTYGHPQIVSRMYIQSLIQLSRVSNNDYKALLKFFQTVNGAVASLRSGGYHHELAASGLLDLIVTKLPSEVQSRWGRQIVKKHPVCLSVQDFATWLNTFVKGEMMAKHSQMYLTQIPPVKSKSGSKPGRQTDSKVGFTPTINAVTHGAVVSTMDLENHLTKRGHGVGKKLICLLCKEDHRLAQCKAFADKSPEERIGLVREQGCCLRCLSRGHMSRDCTSKKKCAVNNCSQSHHSLLHEAPRLVSTLNHETPTEKKPILKQPFKSLKLPLNVGTVSIEGDQSCTVLQIVPITLEADGKTLDTYGFLDPGSQASLILNNAAEQLGLKGNEETTRLGTFHGQDLVIKVKKVKFNIQPRNGSRSFPVNNAFSVPDLNINTQQIEWPITKRQWNYLSGVELPFVDASKVTTLIGRDVMRVHDVIDQRIPPDGMNAPDGILTHFGWSIAGPVPVSLLKPQVSPQLSVGHISRRQSDEILSEAVQRFWLTESFGVGSSQVPKLSLNDQKALRILQDTIRHTGERYEFGLMFRHPEVKLPNNAEVAFRQFLSLERRFKKDPAFAKSYAAVVNEYISDGHAKPVKKEALTSEGSTWYLPHHGVTTASKPGKVRVVFNPSARFRGTSLNEQLFKGPDMLTPLIGVLLRFRRLPIAISGDIKKMYHQVQVPEPQQSFLRFLWKEPGSWGSPQTFQMRVHVFGAVSSPTSCMYALRRTAEDFGAKYPNAAERVLQNIYVDNYLDSAETESDAIIQRQDVTNLLKCGGFNMVQWLSSSRPVLASVEQPDRARALDLNADPLPIERTLGLLWDCQTDTFLFTSTTRSDVKTKREVLQEIASIFDPMGFSVPIVMVAKILMQDIWRSGIDWDDSLPASLLFTWKTWVSDLASLSSVRIPQCFRRASKSTSFQLHVFTDASEVGFAACVYLRATYGHSHFGLRLVFAKSRVAPLRQLSIPRLELQGALLGAQLCASVVKELGPIASAVFYWCDSQTVLQWLHSKTCKYHAFVAHRVTEILDTSSADQWRHIPGELNPAHDGSRGISAAFFTPRHRWFRGPDFLLMPEFAWPPPLGIPEPPDDDPEVSPAKWIGSLRVPTPHRIFSLIQRSSDLIHLKRVIAWLLRFFAELLSFKKTCTYPQS